MNGWARAVSWRGAGHVWMRDFTVYRRTAHLNLIPNFFEPIFYLVAMGIGLGAYMAKAIDGIGYLEYIAPGLIVASAMNGATFETTYNIFVKMHFGKTYDAITATPVNLEDAMVGEILWGITRGIIYGVIFAVVVAAMGLFHHWSGFLILPLILLTAWLFAAQGLLFTSFAKVIDFYSFYYTLWLTPLFLFSGIFFPVSGLPAWTRVAAWLTPLYHCVNLGKAAVHGTWNAGLWVDLAWVVAVAAVCSVWAVVRVRRSLFR